jgi:hypothetical protein
MGTPAFLLLGGRLPGLGGALVKIGADGIKGGFVALSLGKAAGECDGRTWYFVMERGGGGGRKCLLFEIGTQGSSL